MGPLDLGEPASLGLGLGLGSETWWSPLSLSIFGGLGLGLTIWTEDFSFPPRLGTCPSANAFVVRVRVCHRLGLLFGLEDFLFCQHLRVRVRVCPVDLGVFFASHLLQIFLPGILGLGLGFVLWKAQPSRWQQPAPFGLGENYLCQHLWG
jgi:hypothetical protein